jgi:hypothetical protein
MPNRLKAELPLLNGEDELLDRNGDGLTVLRLSSLSVDEKGSPESSVTVRVAVATGPVRAAVRMAGRP